MEQPNSKQPDIKPTEQQQHASSAFPEITKPINERPGRESVYLTDCDIKWSTVKDSDSTQIEFFNIRLYHLLLFLLLLLLISKPKGLAN